MLKKKRVNVFILILVICALAVWIVKGNGNVAITEYTIENEKIPESFSGFKILHISDLHNAELGEDNEKVTLLAKTTDCDIIVMTGDMIDSRNTKVDVAVDFAKEMINIAPVYYVTGNHEARVREDYEKFREELIEIGVTVLENETVKIERNGEKISLVGIHDTGFDFNTGADYLVKGAIDESDDYKVLLSHRPEYFEKYDGVDLIFSGHAHGGQIRLPFIGGLFAPGQGIFPKFDGGCYEKEGKAMVVSRGLGNSLFPVRINNNPEIVVVTLKRG